MKHSKTLILTFDDAVSNHATLVAPLLRELGFGATFFICEFPPDFAENKLQYMTWEQIRSLHLMGFELGNHTLHHPNLAELTPEEFETELDTLEERFHRYGLPRATSFAYPGGPSSDYAVPILKRKGYQLARKVEERAWNPEQDDPFYLPSIPVHGPDDTAFERALALAAPGAIPVLLYHGIPEYTHPWVNTPPECFTRQMRRLAAEKYRVLSFAGFQAAEF